jgi:hypothetical protein
VAIRSWTQVGLPCAKPIGIDSPGRKVLGKLPPATESRGTRSGARLLSGMAAGDQGVRIISILRHLRIYPICPGENASCKVVHLPETCLAQKGDGFAAAHAGAAMGHDLAAGIEFVDTLWQIAQGDEVSADVADLVFVRLAHVKDEDFFPSL